MGLFSVTHASKEPVMNKMAVGLKFGNLVGLRLTSEAIILLSQFRHQGYRLGKVYSVRGEQLLHTVDGEVTDDGNDGDVVTSKSQWLGKTVKKVAKGIAYPEGIHITLVDDLHQAAYEALAALREVKNGVCTMRTPYPVLVTGIVAEGMDSKGHGLVARKMYVPTRSEVEELYRTGTFSRKTIRAFQDAIAQEKVYRKI